MIVRAINIPHKFKFKELVNYLQRYERGYQSGYEVVFKLKSDSFIILYSFGAYTLVNVSEDDRLLFTRKLSDYFKEDMNIISNDEMYEVIIGETNEIEVEHSYTKIPEFKLDIIRIISLVIAESVAMEHLEIASESMISKSIDLGKGMKNFGKLYGNQKELYKAIGNAVVTRLEMLDNLYVYDSPDETWNNVQLERAFRKLKDMFDIEQRFKSLNTSLSAVQESIEIMSNLVHGKTANYLELWIVILIVFEIIIGFIKG